MLRPPRSTVCFVEQAAEFSGARIREGNIIFERHRAVRVVFMPPGFGKKIEFVCKIAPIMRILQPPDDPCPIRNAVERQQMQIVRPGNFIPAHPEIVVQMRAL